MVREASLDRIRIIDLSLRCIVGVNPEERREKQDVVINIVLHSDLGLACRTDRLEDTVDYKAIKKNIIALVEASSFQLLESLAEKVSEVCLANKRVRQVQVTIEKPAALRFARSVAIEITRKRQEKKA